MKFRTKVLIGFFVIAVTLLTYIFISESQDSGDHVPMNTKARLIQQAAVIEVAVQAMQKIPVSQRDSNGRPALYKRCRSFQSSVYDNLLHHEKEFEHRLDDWERRLYSK